MLLSSALGATAQTLSGTVMDSANHKFIVGASVSIPELKKGATTDGKGAYRIAHVPPGTYTVQMESLGYAPVTRQITVSGDATLDFVSNISTVNLNDIVITSLGNATIVRRAPTPVTVVSHDMLLQQPATNAIDAIAKLPGVTAITTGPGVSKPEINGLGYNRVLTLFDGERQEDFQWGDEHGILIDPYAVYSAEIIRGPASLQYGANAVAGVVAFKSEPLPESGTPLQGSAVTEYQTNMGLLGTSLDLAGADTHGFKWDVRGSYEAAHDYWDPHDGYVWGTAWVSDNVRAVAELDRAWGYSRFTVSLLHRQIEIPDGNRDSATGQFEFDVPLGASYVNGQYVPGSGKIFPTLSNFLSYNPDIAGYQVMDHDVAWWQNSIHLGAGKIEADIGYSQSIRHEIDTGNVGQLNMAVHDIPYSLKYQLDDDYYGLKLTTGVNGTYEFQKNFPEPPAPYVGDFEIPNYRMFDIGGYGIVEKDFKNLTLSGGLRYDVRTMVGDPMYLLNYDSPGQEQVPAGTQGAYTQFPPFSNTYTGFSGSLGASYQLPKRYYVKANIARSFRAPAINELTSNELDPSNVFKQGNPNLKPEQGYEVDIAVGNYGRDVSFEADAFFNHIEHFIFADRIQSAFGGDSVKLGAPVYKYNANSATLGGVTAYMNVHPETAKWMEWDNGFTYIYSFLPGQTDSTQHVPFTPAPRLTSDLRLKLADREGSVFKGAYVEFGLAKYWPQNNIYSALYNELPSLGYTLFNAGVGTSFVSPRTGKVVCSVFVNVTNLMNISYIDHTSRPQYFWAYNGVEDPTNFGATAAVVTNRNEGIFNMGRNIGFKAIFPFGGHKVSDTEMRGMQE